MKYQMYLLVLLKIFIDVSNCQWIQVEKSPDSPCYKFKCPFRQRCTVINNQPICKCNDNCAKSHLTGPVCATNGHTFKSLCELKKKECKTGTYILVNHYGNCTRKVICHDSPREKKLGLCADWHKHGACTNHQQLMLRFCPATCNFCDKKKVPNCEFTSSGCCRRKSDLLKLGRNDKGCYKGCRDGRTCPFFPNFCGNDVNKKTMRKYCPYTCRYCVPEGNHRIELLTEDNL